MKSTKKLLSSVIGLVSVILGIVCFTMDTGSYEPDLAYGGDAYTGIQNAAAGTARNIQDLAEICKFGFGSILLVFGLVLILYAITHKDAQEYSNKFDMVSYRLNEIANTVNEIKSQTKKEVPEKNENSEE